MNARERCFGGLGKHRASFTLVELLVVVAIILILLGLSLKVMAIINRKTATANSIRIVEQVKNALGAYYSTVGSYPPVSSVLFEYENTPAGSLPALPPSMNYKTGLVYYIFSGAYHNPEAVQWAHYLEGIGGYGAPAYSNRPGAFWVFWTNSSHTVCDAWGRELIYSSTGDYQRFTLYSLGANGANENGSGDDIGYQVGE